MEKHSILRKRRSQMEEVEVAETVEYDAVDSLSGEEAPASDDSGASALGGALIGAAATLAGVAGWKYAKRGIAWVKDRRERHILDAAAEIDRKYKAEDVIETDIIEDSPKKKGK